MRRKLLAAMAVLALTVAISGAGTAVVAQDGQGQGQGAQGRGQDQGQRRQMDPEQMRQRMMDNLRERLGASEEDWQALEPKVQAVLEAQQQARAGGGMGAMMGRRGGRQGGPGAGQGGGDEQNQSEVATAARELRSALEDEATEGEVIAQRLEAFRSARSKAEEQLKTAQDELKGLLTQRQEAMLVMMSLLE